VPTGLKNLKFRCTGCGTCCREPLLPLTDADLRRLVRRTGDSLERMVKWVDRNGIDMDDEPEGFVMLRQGKRVMVLRHARRKCIYLGPDDRCTVYTSRPMGCRVFPLDAEFTRDGTLRRLSVMPSVECPYELDGHNGLDAVRAVTDRYNRENDAFHARVADWNRGQRARKRAGKAAGTARQFLVFLGLLEPTKH